MDSIYISFCYFSCFPAIVMRRICLSIQRLFDQGNIKVLCLKDLVADDTETNQDRQYTCNVTLRRVRGSLLPWKSNICYIFVCACVHVALHIQHATRMRHIVTSSMAPQAPPHFSTLSHERRDFREKVTERKMYILIFTTPFVRNISHYKRNLARYCHKCENAFT
jgi:hypothetical protein